MLQPTTFQPDKATSSVFLDEYSDLWTTSPARMSVRRFSHDVNTTPTTSGLLHQIEYIQNCLTVTELVKQQSGMSVNTGDHFKRSYFEESNRGESTEDVEWEETTTRGSKRREVSQEKENRSDRYTSPVDQHHQPPSGGSDLTTEQSAVCMAADHESNSTRSTSSLNEDGCFMLKLHSAVPVVSGHGDLPGDADEDDHSSKLACSNSAARTSYDVHSAHGACTSYTHFPTSCKEGLWLDAASVDDDHIQHDIHDDADPHDVDDDAETDWLELRLGHNVACRDSVAHISRSSSPCTLQLLPEKPDCAVMKEREKQGELRLCCGEHYDGKVSTTFGQANQQLGRAQATASLMNLQNHVNQPGILRENHQHFYTKLMQASGLPMQPPADCTIGQYITSRGLLPIQQNASAVDRSCNPRMLTVDHPSSHMQQLLQDPSFPCSRRPLQEEGMLQSRDVSLHTLQGPRSFKSMVCSQLQEGMAGSHIQTRSAPPLPDFLQQNWDLLASSTSTPSPSCSMLQVAAAPTSFRDLIASSFVKEPLSKVEYGGASSLLPALSKPQLHINGDTALGQHMMWPCNKLHYGQSNSSLINHSSDLAMANERVIKTSNSMEHGTNSMNDSVWLSQALSATAFTSMGERVVEDEEPDQESNIRLPVGILQKALHCNKSKHHPPLKLSTRKLSAADRGSPGFWFALQPSSKEPGGSSCLEGGAGDEMNVPSKASYIRLKNGNVPLSVVKKFLITKLGLSQECQVGFACRGKLLEEWTDLKSIQDDIWIPPNSMQVETLKFKSTNSSNIPKDNVMILTYQILK